MGKFNLNQILNDASRQASPAAAHMEKNRQAEIRRISVFDLVPSEDNFYSMDGIEELKNSIELAGKVLQNFVVVPVGGGKYKIVSGHRRRLAVLALVDEGKTGFELVPCLVEENQKDAEIQAVQEEIMLIAANSQREKTAWDKIQEARRTRALLEKIKKQEKLPGNIRNLVAETLHTSATQVGRFDAIVRNLQAVWMDELKAGRLNLSAAYELSGLSGPEQQAAFVKYQQTGEISVKTAREKKQEALLEKDFVNTEAPVSAEPAKMQPVLEHVSDSAPDMPQDVPAPPKESIPVVSEMQQEPCLQPQQAQKVPAWKTDVVNRLNNLVSYCMDMDMSGDRSRDWQMDAEAVLEAAAFWEKHQHG